MRATGGCHAWQLLMLTPARPCRSFQLSALPCQLAHNKCHCSTQVESNLLTLFLCGQLFLSCVLLLLLLLVTCCLLLLVLRTLGAASPTRSLELTLVASTGIGASLVPFLFFGMFFLALLAVAGFFEWLSPLWALVGLTGPQLTHQTQNPVYWVV